MSYIYAMLPIRTSSTALVQIKMTNEKGESGSELNLYQKDKNVYINESFHCFITISV